MMILLIISKIRSKAKFSTNLLIKSQELMFIKVLPLTIKHMKLHQKSFYKFYKEINQQ